MKLLKWTSDLNTGIDVIDGQHRQIVEYINQLHEANRRQDRSAVGAVIDATVDYTVSHFGFEESLMEEAGYEFLRPHKKVHDLFVKRVSDLQLRFRAGEEVGDELQAMLARWLYGHIRNDDAGYVKAVRASTLMKEAQQGSNWFSRSLQRFFGRA